MITPLTKGPGGLIVIKIRKRDQRLFIFLVGSESGLTLVMCGARTNATCGNCIDFVCRFRVRSGNERAGLNFFLGESKL